MFADRFEDTALARLDQAELADLIRQCQGFRIQIDLLEARALAAAIARHPSSRRAAPVREADGGRGGRAAPDPGRPAPDHLLQQSHRG